MGQAKTKLAAVKQSPYRRVATLLVMLIALACLGLCLLLWRGQADHRILGDGSTWDLRGRDLTQESLLLVGQVACIPDALLTPAEYEARRDDALLLDRAFPQQYGTSRIRILLPDDGWYTLTRTSIDYSTRLYVNGELFSQVGSPGESRQTTVPNIGRITFTAQARDGVIELVQQSANFVHRSGGYHGGWQIGGVELEEHVAATSLAVALELGAYLTLFFLHLLLFLMLPGYRPNLYFAAYCLTWFFRMGTTGSSIFTVLAPWLDWNLKFRMEYSAVPIAIWLTALIIRDVFPGVIQRWVMRVVSAVCAVFLLICLLVDTVAMSWVAPVFLALCVITGIYLIVRFCTKLRRPTIDQCLLLTGLTLIFCTMVRDIVMYTRSVIEPAHLYMEITQVAVLACTLLSATAFFIATMREVAAAKEAEQRLAVENATLSQVNQLKSELMATLSHELRTPLAVMSGYAQLSAQQVSAGQADQETLENLRVIFLEAHRLAELTTGVLHMSVGETGWDFAGVCSAGEAVERATVVCRPILEKHNNRLVVQIPADLPPVAVGSGLIQQVMLNLLSNAGRHMRGGEIHLSVRRQEGGVLAFAVRDTGEGIPQDMLPHVFQRGFSSTRSSGIGLSVCKDLVEHHGGTITIDSTVGIGTCVTFTLPEKKSGEAE